MADDDGVPKVVGVAQGPAGGDDIHSTPNPEGDPTTWILGAANAFLVALEKGTATIRFVESTSGQAYMRIIQVFEGGVWKSVKAIVPGE